MLDLCVAVLACGQSARNRRIRFNRALADHGKFYKADPYSGTRPGRLLGRLIGRRGFTRLHPYSSAELLGIFSPCLFLARAELGNLIVNVFDFSR
jgi:hypothetical protein